MASPPPPPPPPPSFSRKKARILEQLATPDAEYSDASPKGSVDAGIRDLIGEINALDGFVTTSSCAGRVSVFVEGRKGTAAAVVVDEGGRRATVAAAGGKGGGGAWLFVSHEPVAEGGGDVRGLLGLLDGDGEGNGIGGGEVASRDARLVHLKFEPMILHVLTASPDHAQLLLRSGLQAGFRESGAINLTPTTAEGANSSSVTPIVAIRSMGLSFESLIGVREDGVTKTTVSDDYLRSLLRIANERFEENEKRIDRFRAAFLAASCSSEEKKKKKKEDGTEWEDAETRRERKRAEGLRRKAVLQGQQTQKGGEDAPEIGFVDLDFSVNTDFT